MTLGTGDDAATEDLPLAGVKVLAVEQYGAGPWATLQLADLGADVTKIEDPSTGGDVGRYVPPYQDGEDSLFFEAFNRGKSSVSLDLRTKAGREVLCDLVRTSDATFCNLRGDQPERLGLTYEHLRAHNPRIVCCSLSGFGLTGPRASEGAYDYVIQGLAGWMSATGEPGMPPIKSGISLVDFCGGYLAAIALLAGLWQARERGYGCDCDLSLFETAIALLNYVGTWVATAGHSPVRQPNSAHPSIVPFQNFATLDGWIVIACAKQKFWEALCGAMGRIDLLTNPDFADFNARHANRQRLIEILEPIFKERTTDAWARLLKGAGVPSGPVKSIEEALADPQVAARGMLREAPHPSLGTVTQVSTGLRVGAGPRAEVTRGPFRGEHTERVLRERCGYDSELIERLGRDGAFGVEFKRPWPERGSSPDATPTGTYKGVD